MCILTPIRQCICTSYLLLLLTNSAWSVEESAPFEAHPATLACIINAANHQHVPANILLAIGSLEGGKNTQWVENNNGSHDLGYFQINTIHWQQHGGAFTQDTRITPQQVASDGCYNAELAAWLLHRALNATPQQAYWTQVANYHSHTPRHNLDYQRKLIPLAQRWGQWLQQQYAQAAVEYR